MPEIKLLLSPEDLVLYNQARSNFRSSSFKLSTEEKMDTMMKIIALEKAYDDEMEDDFLEEIGWYDIDCHEPDSRFQQFLDEEDDADEL